MQFILNGFIAGSAYALVALSFGLIYIPTRFFHFAHGVVFAGGAYFAFAFCNLLKLPLPVAICFSIAASLLLGMGMELGAYRPLRRKYSSGLVLLIASLGLYTVLQNVISLIFGDDTKTLRTGEVVEGLNFFGARVTPIQIATIVTAAVLFVLMSLILSQTSIGRSVRAVASDRDLALATGVEVDRVILWCFAIGSALAGVAGILVSLDVDMTPTMGMNALMMGVVAMIVGGVGSIPGAALGGLLVGLAQHLGVWKLPSEWQDSIAFFILLVFLLVRPQGILGKPLKRTTV